MEHSGVRSASNLQSPSNHPQTENVQNYSECGSNDPNDFGTSSPAQYSIYDEKQSYQNQSPSLNQLLQNNHYSPYGNPSLRAQVSSNFQTNYWNYPRPQIETARFYHTQYQDTYPPHVNDSSYSTVDQVKLSENFVVEPDRNSRQDTRLSQNNESSKSNVNLHEWKIKNPKPEILNTKDNPAKSESDKLIDKSNSIEMPDSALVKPDSQLNRDYNSNTSCHEVSENNDSMHHNSNYMSENKISQNQMKHINQGDYDNVNFNQMMMHQNANYYSQLRYSNHQNNVNTYINSNNNPVMPNSINRPPIGNYPPFMQASNHIPGYGLSPMQMNQARIPYNAHGQYPSRNSQSPFSCHQEVYMNGGSQPLYSGSIKESCDIKEDSIPPVLVKQETSDSGSTSNKSINVRSSKLKKSKKSESHPTTPVSNTIPSPSQTSMSSIIDENEDSVSSLGPNDSIIMHRTQPQFNQLQPISNLPQTQTMMYPQPYPTNNQMSHLMLGAYQDNMASHQRPFPPNPSMIPSRQYHHQNDSPTNNNCFQKLLDLGTEPERGPWIERYLKFMHENNTPLGAVPTVVKQPLDLFRLYHAVRDRGGLLNVVKTKRWKEICLIVNVNASASGAYTLRRNYIKCLLDYECRFDRNGIDPGPILQEIQSLSDKKKKSTTKTAGSSSSSTISSEQASQITSDFISTPSTPRPPLTAQEFSSPHSFPGHNPYNSNVNIQNNPLINGAMMHRSPMQQYPTQRTSYPGPRMIPFNVPPSSMHHQPIRYDTNSIPPNWTKPVPQINQQQQQQWSSPNSSSNSSFTHPMQLSMSPGTPTNSISNQSSSSQQSQQTGDNFETNTKENSVVKSESRVTKSPDNCTEKDTDKIETTSKSEPNYYSQPYPGFSGQDNSYDFYHHNKNAPNNPAIPSMQYPGYPFYRQYGSTFRQSSPNSPGVSPYYPPNPGYMYQPGPANAAAASYSSNMSNNVPNSANSHSPYYPIGSLQEHTRRMEWKSNYGGMPPPPAPPPTTLSIPSSIRSGSMSVNIQSAISQSGPTHPQYHSSIPPHCNYPNPNHSLFNQQRQSISQSPSNAMANRQMLPNAVSANHQMSSDPMKPQGSSMLSSSTTSSLQNSVVASPIHHGPSSAIGHNNTLPSQSSSSSSYLAQFTHSKSNSNQIKRYEHLFPPNCVEATQLDYSKKRKYTGKDIKSFNSATVTMALKSGLVAEVSWALNYLNIWSRDDSFFEKLSLKNLMPMFQALIDVWRNSLSFVFGYNLFIKDLELPVNLQEKITKNDLNNILKTVETLLKKHRLKIECNNDEKGTVNDSNENLWLIAENMIKMLGCGKYCTDKSGSMVKLDGESKLDSVFGDMNDLVDFMMEICYEIEVKHEPTSDIDVINPEIKPVYQKCKNLCDLWDIGGSDSTFHILPSIFSQTATVINEWHTQLDGVNVLVNCELDHCAGPPEIKRSRCNSPVTLVRSSSTPPNLLHDNDTNSHNIDIHQRHQQKSEVFRIEESLFHEIDEADNEKMLRCLCVSMVIRNLSFVPGNDRIMGGNRGLLAILSRLLLLGHKHCVDDSQTELWWQKWIEDIREHVLVTLVNISSYLQFDLYPDGIIQPIISGLLHWLTCQSSEAEDSLPSHRVLGCRRLSLECLMRLCVHERNIDFIVSPPSQNTDISGTMKDLFDYLAISFCYPEVQVVKEMSLAVMHYLSSSSLSSDIGSIYLANAEPSIISGLITFIEVTESQIRHVVDNMGMEALQARPELMGTSLEFLRHSGALLLRIASYKINRTRFSRDHEIRMLNLVISTVLDQTVAQSISGVLFMLSRSNNDDDDSFKYCKNKDKGDVCNAAEERVDDESIISCCKNNEILRLKSFLTFDDLSFCDKEVFSDFMEQNNNDNNDTRPPSLLLRQEEQTTNDNCIE